MKSVEHRFLVWVVAVAAAAEAALEAVAAAVRSRSEVVFVWAAGAIVLFAVAMHVERVKRREVEF